MIRGGVPPRPTPFVEREEKVREIQQYLHLLKNEMSWVVIHGMGGIGKTVLASEAVRNPQILSGKFVRALSSFSDFLAVTTNLQRLY